MKRKILFILLFLLYGQPIHAQLNSNNNGGRSGDTGGPIQLSPPPIKHKCVETDRGQDFDRPGITTYRRTIGTKVIKTEVGADSCDFGGVTLKEYYCEGNQMKSVSNACDGKGCHNNYCKRCSNDDDCEAGKNCNPTTKQCEAEPYCERRADPGRIENGKLVDDGGAPATYYDSCFNKSTLIRYECAPNGEVIRSFIPCPTDKNYCNNERRDSALIGLCQ